MVGLAGARLSSRSNALPFRRLEGDDEDRTALPFRVPFVPRRFIALFLFCWFAVNNGFSWLMFAPVTHRVVQLYRPHVTLEQVELLNSWQPLIYCVVLIPMLRMLSKKNGLRGAIIFGAQLEVAGALLKLLSTALPHALLSVVLLHAGQMLSAISSPVAIGAPALLSASFFPPHLRTTCTGLAVVSNNIGNALSYILTPSLTLAHGFEGVVWFEVLNGMVFCVLAVLFMPQQEVSGNRAAEEEVDMENDDTASSATTASPRLLSNVTSPNVDEVPTKVSGANEQPGGDQESDSVACTDGDELRSPNAIVSLEADEAIRQQMHENKKLRRDVGAMLTKGNVVLLMLMYAWCSGGYVAWTSLFDVMLDDKFGVLFIGTLSLMGTLGYILGGIVTAIVTDIFFRRRMKEVILFCCVFNAIGCGLFALSISHATNTQNEGGTEPSILLRDIPPPDTAPDLLRSSSRRMLAEGEDAMEVSQLNKHETKTTNAPPEVSSSRPFEDQTDINSKFWNHYMRFVRELPIAPTHTMLLVLVAFCGFFNGSSAPVFFELVAEIAYPINEAISGNIMSMAENIGSLVLYQLVARTFALSAVNYVFTFGMGLTVIVGLCVQARYRRQEAQEAMITYRLEVEEQRARKLWATEHSRLLTSQERGSYGSTSKVS